MVDMRSTHISLLTLPVISSITCDPPPLNAWSLRCSDLNRYLFYTPYSVNSYEEAVESCAVAGGQLVSNNFEEYNECLAEYMGDVYEAEDVAAYIGVKYESESWIWMDGTEMSSTNGAYNNCTQTIGDMCSNEGGNCLQATYHLDPYSDCVEKVDFFWRSISCNSKRHAICEYVCPTVNQYLMYTTDSGYTNNNRGSIYVYAISATSDYEASQGAIHIASYVLPFDSKLSRVAYNYQRKQLEIVGDYMDQEIAQSVRY